MNKIRILNNKIKKTRRRKEGKSSRWHMQSTSSGAVQRLRSSHTHIPTDSRSASSSPSRKYSRMQKEKESENKTLFEVQSYVNLRVFHYLCFF